MILGMLWVIACLNSPPIQPPPATVTEVPTETPPTPSVEGAECIQACLRQNMARAVSADVIKADCEQSCDGQRKGAPSLLEE